MSGAEKKSDGKGPDAGSQKCCGGFFDAIWREVLFPTPPQRAGGAAHALAGRAAFVKRRVWSDQGLWKAMMWGALTVLVLDIAALCVFVALWADLSSQGSVGTFVQGGQALTWWYLILPVLVSVDMMKSALRPEVAWKGERVYIIMALGLVASQLARVSHKNVADAGVLNRAGATSAESRAFPLAFLSGAASLAAAVTMVCVCALRDRGIGPAAKSEDQRERVYGGLPSDQPALMHRLLSVLARYPKAVHRLSITAGSLTVLASVYSFIMYVITFQKTKSNLSTTEQQDAFSEANSLYVWILLAQVISPCFVVVTLVMRKQALLKIAIAAVSFITAAQTPVSISRSIQLAQWFRNSTTTSTTASAHDFSSRRLLQVRTGGLLQARTGIQFPVLAPFDVLSPGSAQSLFLSECDAAVAAIEDDVSCHSVRRSRSDSTLLPATSCVSSTATACTDAVIRLESEDDDDVTNVFNTLSSSGLTLPSFGTLTFRSSAAVSTASPQAGSSTTDQPTDATIVAPPPPPTATATRSESSSLPTGTATEAAAHTSVTVTRPRSSSWVNPFSSGGPDSYATEDPGTGGDLENSAAGAAAALGLAAATVASAATQTAAEAVVTNASTQAATAAATGAADQNVTAELLMQANKGAKAGRAGKETHEGSFRVRRDKDDALLTDQRQTAEPAPAVTPEGVTGGQDDVLVAQAMTDCLRVDATPDLAFQYGQVFMPAPDEEEAEASSRASTTPKLLTPVLDVEDVDEISDPGTERLRSLMLHWALPFLGTGQLAGAVLGLAGLSIFWSTYGPFVSSAAVQTADGGAMASASSVFTEATWPFLFSLPLQALTGSFAIALWFSRSHLGPRGQRRGLLFCLGSAVGMLAPMQIAAEKGVVLGGLADRSSICPSADCCPSSGAYCYDNALSGIMMWLLCAGGAIAAASDILMLIIGTLLYGGVLEPAEPWHCGSGRRLRAERRGDELSCSGVSPQSSIAICLTPTDPGSPFAPGSRRASRCTRRLSVALPPIPDIPREPEIPKVPVVPGEVWPAAACAVLCSALPEREEDRFDAFPARRFSTGSCELAERTHTGDELASPRVDRSPPVAAPRPRRRELHRDPKCRLSVDVDDMPMRTMPLIPVPDDMPSDSGDDAPAADLATPSDLESDSDDSAVRQRVRIPSLNLNATASSAAGSDASGGLNLDLRKMQNHYLVRAPLAAPRRTFESRRDRKAKEMSEYVQARDHGTPVGTPVNRRRSRTPVSPTGSVGSRGSVRSVRRAPVSPTGSVGSRGSVRSVRSGRSFGGGSGRRKPFS